MKKIKLSVAALLIASSGFGGGNNTTNTTINKNDRTIKEIIISCEDIMEWINEDVYNDRMSRELADLYIDELLNVVSKVEDLDYNINTK